MQQHRACPYACRYGENWHGPGWAPGEVFQPSRDVCAMPFSATDVREETLHTYANVTVRAGWAGARGSATLEYIHWHNNMNIEDISTSTSSYSEDTSHICSNYHAIVYIAVGAVAVAWVMGMQASVPDSFEQDGVTAPTACLMAHHVHLSWQDVQCKLAIHRLQFTRC